VDRSQESNLALRTTEQWRPPSFPESNRLRDRAIARLRRFFDLQAGSLWRDLVPVLSVARGTVVDAGCGASPYRRLLPTAAVYIGLDTEQAAGDFGYTATAVRRFGADGSWPVADGEADLVLATETLEHVAEPQSFLSEAFRCLSPDGQLVLTVPFAARWHYIPHDYWRFTPSALAMLLEQAGFDDVLITGRGNERTVACYKALALLLPSAMPQGAPGKPRLSPRAALAAPFALLLAGLGNLTLRRGSGDDCLGYTVTARRP
jgi:SAM-dependent methyltransferase